MSINYNRSNIMMRYFIYPFQSKHFWCFLMFLVNLASFAQEEEEEGPDPPPAAHIDKYVLILFAIAILYTLYVFYKKEIINRK